MPELPEVEIMSRNIRKWTEGQSFVSIDGLSNTQSLLQKKIGKTFRKGKNCIVPVENNFLLIHFRMTGKMLKSQKKQRFERYRFVLDNGVELCFVDQRRFGTIQLISQDELSTVLSRLGPEIWPANRTAKWYVEQLGHMKGAVKNAFMRQELLAGMGNIMASEVCFRMKCHPERSCDQLSKAQWERISPSIHSFVSAVLKEEGGDEIHFVSQGGSLPNSFCVYGRAGELCAVCQNKIVT